MYTLNDSVKFTKIKLQTFHFGDIQCDTFFSKTSHNNILITCIRKQKFLLYIYSYFYRNSPKDDVEEIESPSLKRKLSQAEDSYILNKRYMIFLFNLPLIVKFILPCNCLCSINL